MELTIGKKYLVNVSAVISKNDWQIMEYLGFKKLGFSNHLHHFHYPNNQTHNGSIGFGTIHLSNIKNI